MKTRQYLLVRPSQPENRHGQFAAEILRAEGLMGFETHDIDRYDLPNLAPGDLVLLTRCVLRAGEIDTLLAAVERGTRLVCLAPCYELAGRLGFTNRMKVLHPGWVRVRDGLPGAGAPLQTHVPLMLFDNPGWDVAADATDASWTDTPFPAVVHAQVGEGRVALFFYDLAAAVARIRFGDPELAAFCTSGTWAWTHAADLFACQIDERVCGLPQADFHAQLLAHVTATIAPYPLPRFWYYPEAAHRSVAVFQSDDDMSTPAQFAELSACLDEHGATCTFYLMKETLLGDAEVAALRARGYTFAPHANPLSCTDTWYYDFPRVLAAETDAFRKRHGPCSTSIQCHCGPWQGFMQWAPHFMANGYRLLFAYMSAPIEMLNRLVCGSGRAMRLADADGRMLDCWQQPIVCYDDTTVEILMREKGLDAVLDGFRALLRQAVEVSNTGIGILSHPVSFATYSRPFIGTVLDMLSEAGVPVLNGDEWCAFLDRRDAVRVSHEVRDDGIDVAVEHLAGQLPLMFPVEGRRSGWSVTVNGRQAPWRIERRLGREFLFVDVESDGTVCRVEFRAADSREKEAVAWER